MYEKASIKKKNRLIDWKKLTIKDNGEKLVSLKNYINKGSRIVLDPRYFKDGHKGAFNDIFAREQICSKLDKVANMLPQGYKLIVWDSFRPVSVQESLFNMVFEDFRKDNETWGNYNDEKLKKFIATNCCSLPSINPLCPAPHNTGGAVDLSIIDNNGNLIEMGTNFDEFKDCVPTRYYEEKVEKGEKLTEEEKIILNNRRLLYHIMIDVGFENFTEEWWHYDFGDQFWASYNGEHAIYGAATLDEK